MNCPECQGPTEGLGQVKVGVNGYSAKMYHCLNRSCPIFRIVIDYKRPETWQSETEEKAE